MVADIEQYRFTESSKELILGQKMTHFPHFGQNMNFPLPPLPIMEKVLQMNRQTNRQTELKS